MVTATEKATQVSLGPQYPRSSELIQRSWSRWTERFSRVRIRPSRSFCFFALTGIMLMVLIYSSYHSSFFMRPLTIVMCSRFTIKLERRNASNSIRGVGLFQIPKILHQTYKTASLPIQYMPFVTKCRQLNPDWQYFLWCDQDILAFVRKHFPQYLAKYLGFKINLQRADMIRYMLLYHFGGVYIDMDVECIRPFFPGLAQSSKAALLDQERPEHANILYGREFTAMNSAMAAPPRHPFFLEVLRTIDSVGEDVREPGWSTGPELVTLVYKDWVRRGNETRFPVKLLPPEIFSPLVDVAAHNFRKTCANKQLGSLATPDEVRWFKRGCKLVAAQDWRIDSTSDDTIGRHQFLHLGYSWNRDRLRTGIHCNVSALHPSVVRFTA